MLEIQLNNKILQTVGDVKLSRFMRDNPSNLTLKFRKEDVKNLELGDVITLKYNNQNAFKGYIFKINENETELIEILALDQLRYLKNQHVMTIKNKTATALIKELAHEFNLKLGAIDETSIDIATKQIIIENKSLFEIIYQALDDTMLENKKNGRVVDYVLYDDFGKLTLKKQNTLNSEVVFEASNIIKYSNNRSIDSETYNRIFIYYKDEKEKKVDKYIIKNSDKEAKWGVLQKAFSVEKISKDKASEWGAKLLKYFSTPKWSFSITTVATDINIRGGSNVYIKLQVNDKLIHKKLIVDSVIHKFTNNEYTMDLNLLGVDDDGVS